MNVIFMGTPGFSVPTLLKVANSNQHEVLAVFTKPDKVNNRGNKIEYCPVKKCAIDLKIPVFQPTSLKVPKVYENLSQFCPDLILVVAYGKILPKNIINLPEIGCINLHGSLLPKYRGAAPIQRAIMNGELLTGVTTMFMDEGMDTGDMLMKKEVRISENDGATSIFSKLSVVGADLVLETLDKIDKNTIAKIQQKNDEATYAPPINKEEALIDWKNCDAVKINNLIRGLDAGPAAYTTLNKKRLKFFKSKVIGKAKVNKTYEPGRIISEDPFIVCCSRNTFLEIVELQPENKKRMNSSDFVRGNKVLNHILGV